MKNEMDKFIDAMLQYESKLGKKILYVQLSRNYFNKLVETQDDATYGIIYGIPVKVEEDQKENYIIFSI